MENNVGEFIKDVLVKTDSKKDKIDFSYLYILFKKYNENEKFNKSKFSIALAKNNAKTTRYRINGKQKTGLEYYKLNAKWLEENNFNDDDL